MEPASGESVIGLAWLRAARSATDRKQLFFILYFMKLSCHVVWAVLEQTAPWRGQPRKACLCLAICSI